jgi:chromosome segregation ATPase
MTDLKLYPTKAASQVLDEQIKKHNEELKKKNEKYQQIEKELNSLGGVIKRLEAELADYQTAKGILMGGGR